MSSTLPSSPVAVAADYNAASVRDEAFQCNPGGNAPGLARACTAGFADVPSLLEDVARHYQSVLRSTGSAIRYLRARGIGGGVAVRYGLGYAEKSRGSLAAPLRCYDEDAIEASGLCLRRDTCPAGPRVPFFRHRIMFPIRDRGGNVVGFGGRTLGRSSAKYLNSRECATFQKRALLFGLNEARYYIEAYGYAVVVEGYFDVLALAQERILTAVGTLGTACTDAHISALRQHTDRIIFCFDGDAAGSRAADRVLPSVVKALHSGLDARFVRLPAGWDPDSYVRRYGAVAFRRLLSDSVSALAFLTERLEQGCDLRHAEGRSRCTNRARPFYIAMAPCAQRSALLDYCTTLLGCDDNDLLAIWLAARDRTSRMRAFGDP